MMSDEDFTIPQFLKDAAIAPRKPWKPPPAEKEEKAWPKAPPSKKEKPPKAKKVRVVESIDHTGKRWDPNISQWVFPKVVSFSKGEGKMEVEFANMNGPQLVAAYNKMAESLKLKPVARFSAHPVGVKRCQELAARMKELPVTEIVPATTIEAAKKEESEVPKAKANVSKPVKTAKKVIARKPKSDVPDNRSKIAIEFDARAGTVRQKLLDELHANYRKMIDQNKLLKACYGSMNNENVGALNMSVKGALKTIKDKKLGYEIRKVKDDKGVSFGLYPK